jgi:hypothetical protein
VVSGLIVEATGTKNAIEEAHAAVESSLETARAPPPAPAPATSNGFDGDLFGFDAPAPAPMPPPTPLRAPTLSYSSTYSAEDPEPQAVPSMLSNHSEEYGAAPLPGPAPGGSHGYSAPGPAPGGSYEYSAPEPAPSHQRTVSAVSTSYDDNDMGAPMGGAPTPLPTEAAEPPSYYHQSEGGSTGAAESSYYGQNAGGPTPTVENIAEMRRKAKEAEDLAKDAEESRRQVMAQVNELRRVSDEAEAVARQNATSPQGTKQRKGFMGGGGKKKKKADAVCLMSCVIVTTVLATE